MEIKLANAFAGIVIILSDTQKICLSHGDVMINLVDNKHGCIEPCLPDGTLIEVLVLKECKKEYIKTSSVDLFCP